MGKRFKLRLSRVIPTFQSCKSKNPSNLPATPSPIFMLSPINPKSIDIDFPSPSSSHPTTKLVPYNNNNNNSSITRHVSSAMVSVGCGCKSKSTIHYISSSSDEPSSLPPPPSSSFQWKKEDKYHVITKAASENNATTTSHRRKIYTSSSVSDESDDNIPLTPPSETDKKNRRKKHKKKKPKQKVRFSFSSADSSGLFSSGGEEETETLMSSSSTDFEAHLETIRETPTMKMKKKKKKKKKRYGSSSETEKAESSPARLSVFQKLFPTSCKVQGKVKESFAVVKKSEDPFEDFKRSMVEMILEKEMFDVGDLEQLLHCFLSLNSRHHHGVIVDAFTEIWEALFCKSTQQI